MTVFNCMGSVEFKGRMCGHDDIDVKSDATEFAWDC
jgi:hypothetical protein